MTPFALILPAAGRSTRFGSNKLLQPLAGRPVLARALDTFLARPDVAQVLIPTADPDALRAALGPAAHDPRLHFCPGGEHRAASVRAGARAAADSIEFLAVHDAARPLVSHALIDRTLAAALAHGAAAPAMPVHLTVKQAAGPLPAPVGRTIPRAQLFAMQTPQIMRRRDLLRAFDACPIPLDHVTDDLQLLELAGLPAMLVPGEERNLKITTAIDLTLAESYLNEGPH